MTLTIKVQVDRLPDFTVGAAVRHQLGLRVSAIIATDPAQPTLASDCDLILPWRWRAHDGAEDGSWNVHDKANWTIWMRDHAGVLTQLDQASFEVAVQVPAGFDPPSADGTAGRFRARLAQEVSEIVRDAGVAALQSPLQGGRITGRTVFGLAESLTALPSPVPAAMHVWTAVTLADTVTVDADSQFIAVPAFTGSNGALYQPAAGATPSGPADDGAYGVDYAAPLAPLRGGRASIHPSLPMRQLEVPTGDVERLVDLSTLLVRNTSTPFEGSDWSSTLALGIAEAIDPSARAMAVLDDVIRASALAAPDATRAALSLDLLPVASDNPPDRLRRLLAALHGKVASARARSARTVQAPALSFLERLAVGNSGLWPAVAPLLFAHAGAEDDATLPALPPHALIGRAHLAQLGGVAVPRQDVLDDPVATVIVDGEQAFRNWLVGHWTGTPANALVMQKNPNLFVSLFAGTHTRLVRKDDQTHAQTERTGVLDLMQLDRGTTIELPLALTATGAALPERIDFKLANPAAIESAAVTFTLGITPLTLAINGKVIEIGPSFVACVLTMHIREVSTDTAQPKKFELSISFLNTAQRERQQLGAAMDIGEIARSGRLGLEAAQTIGTGGAPLAVAIDSSSARQERLRAAAGPGGGGQALRAALALAYAGPAVAALMNGRAPLRAQALTASDAADDTTPAGERLSAAIARYVEGAQDFNKPFADAIAEIDAGVTAGGVSEADKAALETLKTLMGALRAAAKADAGRLALQLIPPPDERDTDRITQDALPLSFAVDQLQDFDDTVDLWSRLAGLGVLIGRDTGGTTTWWSLNAASLHVSVIGADNARAALGADNAVRVDASRPHWWKAAQVDPVPLVVTEIQGVRNAVIRYESQSIIAETQKRPRMDPHGQARLVARRPEAYLFPVEEGFPKLPPLTFGRLYKILPYLIGHGGVVPPAFRADASDPCSWIAEDRREQHGGFTIAEPEVAAALRSKHYLRSVPVGAPRLVSRLPGLIDGVATLAAELPVMPTPITLRNGQPARFFLDQQQTTGMLACPPGLGPESAGVHIDIDAILPAAGARLDLRVRRRNAGAGDVLLDLLVECDALIAARDAHGGAGQVGIRIQVLRQEVAVGALVAQDDACAEDQPALFAIVATAVAAEPVSGWTACSVEVTCHGADVDMVPPSVQWGARDAGGALALYGERGMYPAELVPRTRATTILDGIGTARERVWPSTAIIELERPATPLATYDRWINGPIGGYGAAPAGAIVAALGHAARIVTNAGADDKDRTLDDPAVAALVYELVQLFPTRQVVQPPTLIAPALDTLSDLLGTPGSSGTRRARLKVVLADAPGAVTAGELRLAPGHVYELRLYGAVADSQGLFAPAHVKNIERFAPAVAAFWRDVTVDGRRFHLGAPLVHTFEVASGLMPELYLPEQPFYVTLRRPPDAQRDKAVIRLAPDRIRGPDRASHVERYQALRMIDRIGLLEQRWSWRGRPHAELGAGTITDFGGVGPMQPNARDFIDTAFLGRRNDDIGAVTEIRIQRSHIYAGATVFERAPQAGRHGAVARDLPVVMESDLDYRGGANLWRFGIRARSRYAAMRPSAPAMLRFSHLRRTDEQARWLPLIVPEQANPQLGIRKPKRPNLMLVIPLTEALVADGCVPPLLALFNEPMFPLFHAGDAIEAVIEVARHPFPALERIPRGDAARAALEEAWKQVEQARSVFDDAAAALALLQQTAASPAAGAIDAAKAQVAQTGALYDLAAGNYAAHLAAAGANGYKEQLVALYEQVKASLQASQAALAAADPNDTGLVAFLQYEIKRYEDRVSALLQEIQDADKLPTDWRADAGRNGNPSAKYWPELAPDPIRTGAGASGKPLALRCDGPVGYTFDLETEAGRFDHAGLLLSPVADSVRPWSMVKLRFRRLETPELLTDSTGAPMAQKATLEPDPALAARYALASSGPAPRDKVFDYQHFDTAHEGLAVDLALDAPSELSAAVAATSPGVRVSFDAPGPKDAHQVTVTARFELRDMEAPRLVITAGTQLGMSTPWSISVEAGSLVELRLVISQQAVPEAKKEAKSEAKALPPRGDVSVRVRITPRGRSGQLGGTHEHAWLSVICMPLTANTAITDWPPLIHLQGANSSTATVVRPIRLSEFTPGVWCQFAAAMSRVMVSAMVKTAGGQREICQSLPVSDLTAQATKDGASLVLGVRGLPQGESLTSIALYAEGAPDAQAQVEECLYAVVTRYIYDAFDLVRERPLSIHRLPHDHPAGATTLSQAVWPANGTDAKAFDNGSGRIRIVRVLRGKTRDTHGFEKISREFPRDFFGDSVDNGSGVIDAPSDGAGQILGISQPFEWTKYV